MIKNLCMAGILLATLSASPARAADIGALSENCNGCHGDNGVSQWEDVPTIAGLAEFVHSEALFTYRDNARPSATTEYRQGDTSRAPTSMCEISQDLSDDQIEALAVAYSELPYVPAEQVFDPELAVMGQAIHEQHCDRCHSDAGMNPDDEAGMLGGQWMVYLATAMDEFAAGARPQPEKMQEKIELLSDDDVVALLNYYAGQQ